MNMELSVDMLVDDNDLSFLTDSAFQGLPAATLSTSNSSASSPPTTEDLTCLQQDYLSNIGQFNPLDCLNSSAAADSKNFNAKRGPGRPRKDINMLMFRGGKVPIKRKNIKDSRPANDRSGLLSFAPSSSESSNIGFPDEKLPLGVDDTPYFLEKYPGKSCCLCNLGERSALGQGDILRLETCSSGSQTPVENFIEDEKCNSDDPLQIGGTNSQAVCRRLKNVLKCKSLNKDCLNELDQVGHAEMIPLKALLDGSQLYVHRMCAMWSVGLSANLDIALSEFDSVAKKSLRRRCSFCGQFGASVFCKMSCSKVFHVPCAAASGCFLIIENFTIFCDEHLNQVPLICNDANIGCRQCHALGDISKLIMCSTCGDHYHTTCIGLANLPDTRSGWNCTQCSKCQICRQTDNVDGRSIKCEQCQKLYHASCLRPIISSIPKYGWKCNRCRVCTDCGSRTPGAGTSSRWHGHYTICDSCYQQRNKGFSCPICSKAYRAAAHKEMVKCSVCNRFVHSLCDGDADLSVYHKRKENNPDYDYVCPQCKVNAHNEKFQVKHDSDLSSALLPQVEGSYRDVESEYYERTLTDLTSAGGKPFDLWKISKKRIGFKDFNRARGGKVLSQKSGMLTQFGRKRAMRGKNRNMMLMSQTNSGGISDQSGNRSNDDDIIMEKKLLLCSVKDKYVLSQDVCVMCGSLGIDQEGCLIACAQCGQCYHPYCVNIKVTKVVLQKGWRCLDCTVCEGCGQKNDEARLILCDECDISYHIYCMNPPLDTVPHGNWKCKWCAVCHKCGRKSFSENPSWRNGFLECGPCASETICSVCTQQYIDNELIIQCRNCERWLHCRCDSINSVEEAQSIDNIEYHCLLCRPKDRSLLQFLTDKTYYKSDNSPKTVTQSQMPAYVPNDKPGSGLDRTASLGAVNETNDYVEATHWVDGVCMSTRGLNMIKSLMNDIKKKRKIRLCNEVQNKASGIMAAIESVVAGSSINRNEEDPREDTMPAGKEKSENYKDGMIWTGADGNPPEGFSITTNDEGINILRKKRQRNLQKLGIGGFNVRNRAFKKESEENVCFSAALNKSSFGSEKKKKIVRKKLKSKLIETYPAYLQEAFFGKTLLTNPKANLSLGESDGSDDHEHASVTSTLFEEKSLNEEKHLKMDKSEKINAPKPKGKTGEFIHTKSNMEHTASEISTMCGSVFSRPQPQMQGSKINVDKMQSNIVSTETQKSLTITTAPFPVCGPKFTGRTEKDTGTGVKLERNICTETIAKATTNVADSLSYGLVEGPLTKNTTLVQSDLSNIISTKTNFNESSSSEKQLMVNSVSVHSQMNIMNPLQQTENLQKIEQQSSFMHSARMIDGSLNSKDIKPPLHGLQPERTLLANCPPKLFVTSQIQTQAPPPEEPTDGILAGTRKTAEKMRRDEDLGEMATISAVLYANTQHPELKKLYPNWNERCKQILKKWRSLSTDKKTPFLQHAKDNRSALRMRKAQQDHDKICFQQKALKEQEQERIWKQHQAKAKEAQASTFGGIGENVIDVNIEAERCVANEKFPFCGVNQMPSALYQQHYGTSVVANTVYVSNAKETPVQCEASGLSEPPNLLLEASGNQQIISENNNKHLRTLLLKHSPSGNVTFRQEMLDPRNKCDNFKTTNMPSSPKMMTPEIMDMVTVSTKTVAISQNMEILQTENIQGAIGKQDKSRYEAKMPDSVDAVVASDFEKLEQDENAGIGDILGGFGEGDDDDLLKSLTAEIGDDFNILEYADPELDEFSPSQNLLNKLDFVDNDKNV